MGLVLAIGSSWNVVHVFFLIMHLARGQNHDTRASKALESAFGEVIQGHHMEERPWNLGVCGGRGYAQILPKGS